MRLLHTSDWHLGHLLLDLPREREHQAFLGWLLDVLEAERIDALLVTGDVFDAGNPPATALAAWYGFLAEAHRRRPAMTTVVIAGNHDSPGRLAAPSPLMAGVRAHVVGALPRIAGPGGGGLDAARLVVPLPRADGSVAAWAVAVPFLRPGDLTDDSPEAVRAVYAEALELARARRGAGEALVAMGHLHLSGGEPSWMSERRVTVGGVEALDGRGFGDDVAYVALGHLHKAQRVGPPHVRYAGSPIPLAMGEADYVHSVVVVELDGERAAEVRTLPVPRAVELRRVPRVAAPLDEVLAAIAALDDATPGHDRELAPYIEVKVRLAQPEPHLRTQIEQAMRGKWARLVKISPELTGDRRALGDAPLPESLAELDPREVLRRRWRRDHQDDVPTDVMAAFEQLLVAVGGPAGGGAA